MDSASLAKRLTSIKTRMTQLSEPEGFPMGFEMERHLESRYFRGALTGEHPFLMPGRSLEDYMERRAHFDGNRLNVTEQFKEVINREEPTGQRWYEPFATRIGIIADEFLFKSFSSTAQFVPLTPQNFREHVGSLDLVLVTSTWRGLGGEWAGASQRKSPIRKLIEDDLITLYQKVGTPVAFYSKEDPPNYDVFLSTAQKCDFVFTSAAEMIETYRADCTQAKAVEVLPFSVDFRHHNPVGSRKHRIGDVLFAGSWHNHKYPERREAATQIFDGVIASDRKLRIIDRNWNLDTEKYLFPEHYLPYVEPAVAHSDLLQIHRTSDIVINLNSVVNSSTMYANRVVELQAMGCTVLSNYNAGVNDQFPNVFMPESSFDTTDILASLDSAHLYRNQMAGLRTVYTEHVNFDRMGTLLAVCGLVEAGTTGRALAIIAQPQLAERFIHSQHFDGELKVYADAAEARRAGMELACDVHNDYEYGRHYLQDLVNATKYSDSTTVFKASSQVETTTHHDFTNMAAPEHGALTWLGDSNSEAPSAYMLDAFEVAGRIRDSVTVSALGEPKLSVIVPIYNNGRHLEFKCFESLRRSSVFHQMEIILVDDGSTDPQTLSTVVGLERSYPNVRAHFCENGGSGSASRPRNIGLEMAAAPWVTYLDPDNEALSDGYAKLLVLAEENNSNFALGNMIRNADRRKLVNYVRILRKQIHQDEVGENTYSIGTDLLPKINFTPMSIQALVANTAWLRSLGLEQPVGAVGQDSYFFQQMLYYATRISLLNEPVHAYFAAVSNSTVNSLGTKFYSKYIPLERERAAWLEKVGLLEAYKERRMEPFVKGWYLDKLQRVAPGEQEESKRLIAELAGFYGAHEWKDEQLREFFQIVLD